MWAIAGQPDITRRLAITSHIKSYVSPKGALIFDHPHNGHRSADMVRRYIREGSLFQSNPAGMVGL